MSRTRKEGPAAAISLWQTLEITNMSATKTQTQQDVMAQILARLDAQDTAIKAKDAQIAKLEAAAKTAAPASKQRMIKLVVAKTQDGKHEYLDFQVHLDGKHNKFLSFGLGKSKLQTILAHTEDPTFKAFMAK